MTTFSFPAQEPPNGSFRIRLRDVAVSLFAALPTGLRVWLYDNLLRPVLWLFFHLEKRPIVLTNAGPSGNRFKMWLLWQSHIIYTLGIYEPSLIRMLRTIVHPGDFCIDAGAHLGYLTLFLSELVGESGRVLSFEPSPENFRVFQENLRINNAANVEAQNVALLDAPGPITMARVSYHTLSWSTSAVHRSEAPDMQLIQSRAVSLDDFLADSKRVPKFIKIDVEGAELLVLRGAVKTLAAAQPLLFLEIHNWPSPAAEEVLRFLSQHGYCHEIVGTRGGEAFCLAAPVTRQSELREIQVAAGV